jgi:hypothetical protein
MIINNILSYFRKNTSTLLVFSAAIALLLLASPLALFNLVPVQAQTNLSFQTPTPANGDSGTLTFSATETPSTSDPSQVHITNGTVQWQWETGQTYTGEIYSGSFNNNSRGGAISFITKLNNLDSGVSSPCRTTDSNSITLNYQNEHFDFYGPVECGTAGDTAAQQPSSSSSQGGGGNTTSSSMTGTTTTQDSDSDGIPDSSDRCPNNSHHRCFKEGDTGTTTTQQEQPSTSSSSGNQTRQGD